MVIDTVNCSGKKWKDSEREWTFVCFCSLLFTFVHFCSLALYGYTYRGAFSQLGDNVVGLTAASSSRGGTAVSASAEPSSVFINPATISVDSGQFIFSGGLLSIYGRRTRNDSVGGTVSNSNLYGRFSAFGISQPVVKNKLSIAVCESELSDFNYFYEENNYSVSQISSTNKIESQGLIYGTGCGLSYYPVESLSFGISAYNLYGKPEGKIEEISYGLLPSNRGQIIADISTTTTHSISGSLFLFGVTYQPTRKMKAAISFRPEKEIEAQLKTSHENKISGATTLTNVKYKYKYPQEVSIGLTFAFPGPSEPNFSFDFIQTKWSEARLKTAGENWTDCGWVDTLSWHAGAEHKVRRDFIFRYGLAFLPDYSRKGSQTVAVSGGAGFKVWIIDWDFAAQYFMRRNTLEDRHFHVAEDVAYPRTNQETVDDYTKRFLLTGKIKW
ncbi:MAG: hypothetical protein HY919_01880 [Elusimicrobia bacterium]|nr:hypothetical protein [Elusimicrobiota bacterium]